MVANFADLPELLHDFDKLVVRQLIDCEIRAALAGVVIGSIMSIVAYQATFYAQAAIYVGHDLKCLVPELFLLTDNSAWHPVYRIRAEPSKDVSGNGFVSRSYGLPPVRC
jgi:hypothetical protein